MRVTHVTFAEHILVIFPMIAKAGVGYQEKDKSFSHVNGNLPYYISIVMALFNMSYPWFRVDAASLICGEFERDTNCNNS